MIYTTEQHYDGNFLRFKHGHGVCYILKENILLLIFQEKGMN